MSVSKQCLCMYLLLYNLSVRIRVHLCPDLQNKTIKTRNQSDAPSVTRRSSSNTIASAIVWGKCSSVGYLVWGLAKACSSVCRHLHRPYTQLSHAVNYSANYNTLPTNNWHTYVGLSDVNRRALATDVNRALQHCSTQS